MTQTTSLPIATPKNQPQVFHQGGGGLVKSSSKVENTEPKPKATVAFTVRSPSDGSNGYSASAIPAGQCRAERLQHNPAP